MNRDSHISAVAELRQQEVVITRIFDAPRDLVWKAWTEPERVKRWWGPKAFTSPFVRIDLRVGGETLYCMRSPEGKDYWGRGVFREVVALERLVVTDSFANEKGDVVPASYYGMSQTWPREMLITVTFEEYDGKTKLTLHHDNLAGVSDTDRDNMEQGWNESFDKLADYLSGRNRTVIIAEPGKQDFIITRDFDAPRELVWKAFTDPELIVQWLGPRRFTMRLEKFEPRSGGNWRYVHRDKDGNEYWFHGVYHEVLEPVRMIDTFEFEGLPEKGHVSLETARFEEIPGGRTRLTIQAVFQSVADRDGMAQSGMEEGVRESHERLDELLKKIGKPTQNGVGRR